MRATEPSGDGRPEKRPRREVVNAILYLPPRQTVYWYLTRW